MSDLKKCNKCGKIIPPRDGEFFVSEIKIEAHFVSDMGHVYGFDLCENCHDKLMDFFESKE